MNYAEESLKKHYEWKGKIEVVAVPPVKTITSQSLTVLFAVPPLETYR